ncbi:hypothetical protein, partial [Clostridium beijerinckii]|uniref:hypothetical protein n=2 Tax=Clostridium TaxID=1485 RepID=UPI0019CFF339
MLNIVIKAIVTGLISTAAVEMTYDIGNKSILAGINIVIIIGAFMAFKIYEENLNKERIYKEEKLERFKEDLLKEVKDRAVLENILAEMRDRTVAENILAEVRDKTVVENIL